MRVKAVRNMPTAVTTSANARVSTIRTQGESPSGMLKSRLPMTIIIPTWRKTTSTWASILPATIAARETGAASKRRKEPWFFSA